MAVAESPAAGPAPTEPPGGGATAPDEQSRAGTPAGDREATSQRVHPGLDRLLDVVWSIPAPTNPPPMARDDQAFGLALLDLSLRLQHVSRMTERLRLVDPGHLERTVGLDLDLTVLTRNQIDTLQPRLGDHGVPAGAALARPFVWVPIARHRRQDVTPVLVRDATDAVLPRLTHHEVTRRVAAGLIRLFRLLLATNPDTTLPGHPLHDLRHEHNRSRWLIEHAVLRLVDDGASGHLRDVTGLSGDATLAPVPRGTSPGASIARARGTDSYSIRARAAAGLELLLGDSNHPFPQLLDVAAGEYLLVVLVPRVADRCFLTYDAPLLPARSPGRSSLRALAKDVLPTNREFTVEYSATVPRAVRSYHVTVDVPEEVFVRRFTVSSDVDAPVVDGLTHDIEAVAGGYDELSRASGKLMELELQAIASRLAELGRRRQRDVAAYRAYLEKAGAGRPLPAEPAPLAADETVRRMAAGDCSPSVLGAFAGHYEADAYRHLAGGTFTPEVLHGIAAGLESAEIGRDLTVDNDPRENGGHAHWRQPLTDLSSGSLEPVRATAYLALADETPSLVESVSRILAGLALVVFGIGALLTQSPTWLFSTPPGFNLTNALARADAIVAVLLLVPGILVARLDIPSTNTVLGQIRSYQRALAYSALVATTGLAMAVAASPPGPELVDWARLSFTVLAVLLIATRVEFVVRHRRRRALIAPTATLPAWLHSEMGGGAQRRVIEPDARFDAVGGA
jgi:hypothetical protein